MTKKGFDVNQVRDTIQYGRTYLCDHLGMNRIYLEGVPHNSDFCISPKDQLSSNIEKANILVNTRLV